jgi:hypothetical protein
MASINYNERSWAVDLISHINQFVSPQNIRIARAGGEQTISTGQGSLFPDVLLFSDNAAGAIIQGWELKMPDTAISNQELLENAILKANNLGLNSFVIWNVNEAVLYVKNEGIFEHYHDWKLDEFVVRESVQRHEQGWRNLADTIISDLDQYFEEEVIRSQSYLDTFDEGRISQLAFTNLHNDIERYKGQAQSDGAFLAEVNVWWNEVESIYPSKSKKWEILSKTNLLNWINKFLFAHILKQTQIPARTVNDLTSKSTFDDLLELFNDISIQCDFWNIFKQSLGEKYLSNESRRFLLEFNSLLNDMNLEGLSNTLLQRILQSSVYEAKRKAAGQYTTPDCLANLLARLVIIDGNLTCHDPFCGTGTIARASYDYKVERGVANEHALSSVLASDKYAFPIQLATIAMSDPENLGHVLRVFQRDIIELTEDSEITYYNPNNGEEIIEEYTKASYILSNLPFIQFEDIYQENETVIETINNRIEELIGERVSLSGKSDLFAYLPFYLWTLTNDNGRLGLIFSNAWLGTDWGKIFRDNLRRFFQINYVVTSAKGRWFQNAEIVTNLVVLNKREEVIDVPGVELISFISLSESLDEINSNSNESIIASHILTNQKSSEFFKRFDYSNDEILELEQIGLNCWNTFFTNVEWLSELSDLLVQANSLFEIGRGERRGWDPMFYPGQDHNIENAYLERCLKDSTNVKGLIANIDVDAFCCSRSIEELKKEKQQGALRWIAKFRNGKNTVGKPLTESLSRANHYWYEMKPNTLADIVGLINYDKRLFFARLEQRAFVNQRLIRFTRLNEELNMDLVHALMNSSLGLFYLEGIGFGRGLGALDLNSTKIRKNLHVLDPDLLDEENTSSIIDSFQPLLNRDVLPIREELEMQDRVNFDQTVLEAYDISDLYNSVRKSLLELFAIRMSVKD